MKKIITPSQNLIIKGEYAKICLPPWIKETSKEISYLREAIRTGNKKLWEQLEKKGIIRMPQFATNLIPTTGRNVLARLITGDVTYSGEVDYGALGDGATAFTNSSTQLNNEIFRKQAADQSVDQNIAYIDWLIASGDTPDDTFEEFGAFIDGNAAANSGQAWSLLITGGWVKAGSIFISGKYTFS